MEITLSVEQEKFLLQQLKTGKYNSVSGVVSDAFTLLEQKTKLESNKQSLEIVRGEIAEQLLQEKVNKLRLELQINQNNSTDLFKQQKLQELKVLFDKTQAINHISEITEAEIAAEIEAYRQGKSKLIFLTP